MSAKKIFATVAMLGTAFPLNIAYAQKSANYQTNKPVESRHRLNENNFITESLNLEGYPRGTGIELRRFFDQ